MQSEKLKKTKYNYFEMFCDLINGTSKIRRGSTIFIMINLQRLIKDIKSEIYLELREIGVNRNEHLEFKINEVEKQNYDKNIDINFIEKWLDEYQIGLDSILNNSFQENALETILYFYYRENEPYSDLDQLDKTLSVQSDFNAFFCTYYANELIEYFKSKMTINENTIVETENINQLSVNQAVILLDKLGIFGDKIFDNLPNTKKAKLISLLLGKNEKNVKTAIEKLEIIPSEITAGYQRDRDKIEHLLSSLE